MLKDKIFLYDHCQLLRLMSYLLILFSGSQRKERKSSANTNKSPKRPRLDSDVNGTDTYSPTPSKVVTTIDYNIFMFQLNPEAFMLH